MRTEHAIPSEQLNYSDTIQNILRYCEQFPEWDPETNSLPNETGDRSFILDENKTTSSLRIELSPRFGNKKVYPFSAAYSYDGSEFFTNVVNTQVFSDKDFIATYNPHNSYGSGKEYEYSQDYKGKVSYVGGIYYSLWNGVTHEELSPLLVKEPDIPKRIDLQQTGLVFLGHLFTRNYETPKLVAIPPIDTFATKLGNGIKEVLWMK